MIETNDNVKVGGFLFEKIDETNKYITDPKSFLFNYSNNKFQSFEILKDESDQTFMLFGNGYSMFSFGRDDLNFWKKECNSTSLQKSYDMNVVNLLIYILFSE